MRMNAISFAAVLLLVLFDGPSFAENRPSSGKKVPGYEPLDKAILKFMDTIDCTAATVAVSSGGQLLYSRGYGWVDRFKKKTLQPDALMRIASVSKPITATAVKNAIRSEKFSLDTKVVDFLGIKPPRGKFPDPRVKIITVEQLLEHKGGWDRDKAFDPAMRLKEIERTLGLPGRVKPIQLVEYMFSQPLQFDPGEKSVYSNFGYLVLGRVLEKSMKKPFIDCVQQSVCKPLGIKDIKQGQSSSLKRDPREVWYPVGDDAFPLEVMDAPGGLIASAPALCQFLQSYWISGEPRLPRDRAHWTFFGSLPGTTAMVRQRTDGINVAILMNGRREQDHKEDNETLKKSIDEALDGIVGER